jgi:hypothetical protein
MTITFSDPKPAPAPSLACKLEVEGCVRFRALSACTLTYEDNAADTVTVWIAEKPRTAVVEVSEPMYEVGSRFIPVHF